MKPEAVTSLHLFKQSGGRGYIVRRTWRTDHAHLPRASQAPRQDPVEVWSGPVYSTEVGFFFFFCFEKGDFIVRRGF